MMTLAQVIVSAFTDLWTVMHPFSCISHYSLQISSGIFLLRSLIEKMLIGGFGIGPFAKAFIADSNVIRCCKGCRVIVL